MSGPWRFGSTTNELDRPFHAILEPLWKGPKILAFLAALKVAEFWHLQFLLLQVQHEAWLRGHFCDADFSSPISDSRGLKPNLAQKTSAASRFGGELEVGAIWGCLRDEWAGSRRRKNPRKPATEPEQDENRRLWPVRRIVSIMDTNEHYRLSCFL